jgi:hypothetical protein
VYMWITKGTEYRSKIWLVRWNVGHVTRFFSNSECRHSNVRASTVIEVKNWYARNMIHFFKISVFLCHLTTRN